MLSKEELIEKMAKAICWAENYCLLDIQREEEFEKCKPYYLDCGNSALQALISSLPWNKGDVHGITFNAEDNYFKLLRMRDK